MKNKKCIENIKIKIHITKNKSKFRVPFSVDANCKAKQPINSRNNVPARINKFVSS